MKDYKVENGKKFARKSYKIVLVKDHVQIYNEVVFVAHIKHLNTIKL